ncbi:23S rRNA pseudouridine(1911/1915/1917) synthase RluD [Acidithiobacillus sp. CV18-2]|uniref:Pseudouridine synthase n=1 Tax=Igneacidithiobacillus copahuensis TaxID=2724909 RepID=A0AAE3CIL9_9PROT|nr:23S rRNA pseudouridine(1911/1915/1917) synthase RluD [Igneacidithiobacillus copahuensis]MBU2753921.1 23S rRNA pseudouridine(1911/1915/1917) synthase RluD [Acidithiobacillus sp. CV18-3]MBU2756149.1 23S rRNA pseudouridine(1911/1915/1917) synthase RluD [Acidithiobacillus sp. BN09-2]MBU2778594.1 23S rRNA pseudouridine(1911/1915/1917) synthase RluD [Acidithiobacillus sp. CV18-2]MBU2797161.1 23S rRNA pseudouridine(1911/1915/1917) synthase RluD [Acidithiobacillus sp. VAN18-2]MBU2798950.1 23S rRNA 
MSSDTTEIALVLPEERAGERLDSLLAELLPDLSRSRIQELLGAGEIVVNGENLRPSHRVHGGEAVQLRLPPREPEHWAAENLPLQVVHEDEEILVLDKVAGMLTHPGAGHPGGTLANAVLAHCPDNSKLPRAGIVHRLDKDTSGLLLVAKTEHARQDLTEQLAERSMHREYIALVQGAMTGGGRVEAPIGRHSHDRLRMAVRSDGRFARTDYRLLERFPRHTLLRLRLATGRTHQIRLHMRHIGHPLVGDPVYGGRSIVPPGLDAAALDTWRAFRRQALHAWRLELEHPRDGELCAWESPLPSDMEELLTMLRRLAS